MLIKKVVPSTIGLWLLFPIGCALAVIGAKCLVISIYGSPTPYWDQWDAEAARLYEPYLNGTLRVSDFFVPHNEHRVVLTRLWSLLLLELNGYWDPLLQMVANSLLFGLAVVLLVVWLRPLFDPSSFIVSAIFCMVIFALPLAWENVLSGFHSQWYFLILFSLAGLLLLHSAAAFSARWWLAMLLLCGSYLCMAGGALTVTAATGLVVAQALARQRLGTKEWIALGSMAAASVLLMADIPALPSHQALRAQSVVDFLHAAAVFSTWPLGRGISNLTLLLYAMVVHGPALLLSIYVIRQGLALDDRRWFAVAITAWTVINVTAIAYGRGQAVSESRYIDILLIALALNCACLLHFVAISSHAKWWRKAGVGAAVLWLLFMLHGTVREFIRTAVPELATIKITRQAQTENLRGYLASADMNFLINKPQLHIPYPDPNRLAAVASAPSIRAILPPELVGEASVATARNQGLARYTGRVVGAFKRLMLRDGFLLMPIGVWLILAGMLIHGLRWKEAMAPTPVPPSKFHG